MRSRTLYQPQPESTCAKVMAFAKQRNSRELMRLLRDGYALNERSLGRDAISYLAEAGDFDAAQYLIDRYELFPDALISIVSGGAIGGHHEAVEHYISRVPNMVWGEWGGRQRLANYYALGGHVTLVNQMLRKINNLKFRYEKIHKLIYYYGLNGNCQNEINFWYSRIDYLARICKMDKQIIRRNFDIATTRVYAQQGLLEDNETLLYAAKGGNERYVHELLAAHSEAIALQEQYYQQSGGMFSEEHEKFLDEANVLILKDYPSIAKKALFHSPLFAFDVIKVKFSNMKEIVGKMIGYGHLNWAADSLSLLRKSFWVEAASQKQRSYMPKDELPECPEGVSVPWFLCLSDQLKKFLDQSESYDAMINHEFDESFDPDLLASALANSDFNYKQLLNDQIWLCFKSRRYSALNMLTKVWVLSFDLKAYENFRMPIQYNKYDSALFAAASIDHMDFRRCLFGKWDVPYIKPKGINKDTEINRLLREAHVINHLMRKYLLDFHQARVMMGAGATNVADARHWIQVYRHPEGVSESLSIYLFAHILSMLLGVNMQDAQVIYEAIITHIFEQQPPGMSLQDKLNVFGLFKSAVQSSDCAADMARLAAFQKY